MIINVTGTEITTANTVTTYCPRVLRSGSALSILRHGEKNK